MNIAVVRGRQPVAKSVLKNLFDSYTYEEIMRDCKTNDALVGICSSNSFWQYMIERDFHTHYTTANEQIYKKLKKRSTKK